jgi:hypothetical protein
MVDYTFTTADGLVVTEYRPFSLSYAILHTPCLDSFRLGDAGKRGDSYAESAGNVNRLNATDDLLGRLTKQKLVFDSCSADVLRQLLAERVAIRDRNRSLIAGRLSDLTGEISLVSQPYALDSHQRKQDLEKTRLNLERELRETDERLWKDTAEIREKLITAARLYDSTSLRSNLFGNDSNYGGDNGGAGHYSQ